MVTSSTELRFSETLKQSVMAYAFNVFGIAAGTIVAYASGLFDKAPWAVVIYPPILSARGVIGGLFCGRLGTALHLGTIHPHLFGNTKSFYLLFQSIVVMTFEASLLMGFIASAFRSFENVFELMNIVMATMTLAIVFISPLTLAISFLSFKHGLDPDIIVYPIESTVADLLITSTFILVLNLFLIDKFFWGCILAVASVALFLTSTYFLVKNARESEFIKTLKESLLTLVLVSFIVNVAGATLGKVNEMIGGEEELRPVYVVYPALIDTIGDVGAVIGSTATTKLALGTIKASFSSIKKHIIEISGAWTASLIMYFIYSVLALTITRIISPLNLFTFTLFLFTVNVFAASLIIIISYAVAILTYQKGLDPDNFEIPIESSLADSITTISLLAALVLWMAVLI